MESVKVFILGVAVYICPPLFRDLIGRWFPGDPSIDRGQLLRRKFWRAFALVICVLGAVLLSQHWLTGGLRIASDDWLRVGAATMAITATLGRGGWLIQTWKEGTVVERIDRGMYVIGQLGAAALLIFVLTL
jgi:hypothetical protein